MLLIPPNDHLKFEGKLFWEESLNYSGLMWAFNISSLEKIDRIIQNWKKVCSY